MNSQVNLDKMKAGGYDMAFFAVYVGQGARTDSGNAYAKDRALNKFSAIHRMAEQMYPNLIEIAYTADDAARIHKSGKLIAGIGIENGWVIGHDLSLIKRYYDLGARYMTLAHTSNNDICDSSTDPRGPEWHGLSPFGRQVVAEMNRVGMMVDVSHVSKECMMQATALSTSPVIGSHSSTTAVANVPRNMDDEMLLAIKQNNGVVQMVALGSYVKVQPAERDTAVRKLNEEFFGPTPQRGGRAAVVVRRRRSRQSARVAPTRQARGIRQANGGDRSEVAVTERRRFRESHRPRREGRRDRSRRHQLRLRRRRRHRRLARRERNVQRHARAGEAWLQRRRHSKAVGREHAAGHGREPEAGEDDIVRRPSPRGFRLLYD